MAALLLEVPFADMIAAGLALCGLTTALLIQCGNKRKAPQKTKGKLNSKRSAKSVKGRKKSSRSSKKDSVSSSKKSSRSSKRSQSSKKSKVGAPKVTSKPKKKSSRSSKRSDKDVLVGSSKPANSKTAQPPKNGSKREQVGLKSLQETQKTELSQKDAKTGVEAVNNNAQIDLHLEPRVLRFSEQGGLSKVQLHNQSKSRQAIKVKCSDNAIYRVNPVYGVLEPGQFLDVEILRQSGQNSKVDKLVFVTAKAPSENFDVKKLFKSAPKEETPRLVLPLLG
jgi:hypothetical protein